MSELTSDLSVHKVTVALGYTFNMGDFESFRVDVGLQASGKGHPDETFQKVYDWCEKKLIKEAQETREELKAK